MFDFLGERPCSLFTVPSSWVLAENQGCKNSTAEAIESADHGIPKSKVGNAKDYCYWPPRGSVDEM